MSESTRQNIIQLLTEGLKRNSSVYAMWLEGADATHTVDQYSDIDVWFDVKDGKETTVFNQIEKILKKMSSIDFLYELQRPHPQIRHKTFHLKGTPDSLLLDICIQSHSRKFTFIRGIHKAQVMFDKTGVVKFHKLNQAKFRKELNTNLHHLKNSFAQQSRVLTKVYRNNFLEALLYYHKWVLQPLVMLLRMKHSPVKYDYYLKHISRDLPKSLVSQIDKLYTIRSIEDIKTKMKLAKKLFQKTLSEIDTTYF